MVNNVSLKSKNSIRSSILIKKNFCFCRDDVTGNLSKSIFSTFTKGENLGGLRLIRGYDEVENFISKKPSVDKSKYKSQDDYSSDRDQTPEERIRELESKQATEDYDNEGSSEIREIDHLILVIHG